MAGEQFVDATYRGIDVGRRLRISGFGHRTAYLELGAPMPVGTEVVITTDQGLVIPTRVLKVQEQHAGAAQPPGMWIASGPLDERAQAWWEERVSGGEDGEGDAEAEAALASDRSEAVVPAEAAMGIGAEAAAAEHSIEAAGEATGASEAELSGDGQDHEASEAELADGADEVILLGRRTEEMAAIAVDGDTTDVIELAQVKAADQTDEDDRALRKPRRSPAPTESMSAVEIEATLASGELPGSAPEEATAAPSTSPEPAGDKDDNTPQGKKRGGSRRRKNRR